MNAIELKILISVLFLNITTPQLATASSLGINIQSKTNIFTPITPGIDVNQASVRFTRIGDIFDETTTIQLDIAPDKTGTLTCRRGATDSTPKIDTSFSVSESDINTFVDLLDFDKLLNAPEKYDEIEFSSLGDSCLTPFRDYIFEITYNAQVHTFERTKRMEGYLCQLVTLSESLCLQVEQRCFTNMKNRPPSSTHIPYYAPMMYHDVLSEAVQVLHGMREPSLFESSQDPKYTSIRVTCLGHYRDSFSVRINIKDNGTGILYYKQINSDIALVKNCQRTISRKQVNCFMNYFKLSNFMNTPSEYRDEKLAPGERYVVADGDSYLFEAVLNGKFHCFERSETLYEIDLQQLIANIDSLSKPIKGLRFAFQTDYKPCPP